MIHVGRTLAAIRDRADLTTRAMAERAELRQPTITLAEGDDWLAMRKNSLAKVLEVLGETHESFMRKVGVGWDGSNAAFLREKVVIVMDAMDEDALLDLHHAATTIRDADRRAGDVVDEARAAAARQAANEKGRRKAE